MSKSNMKDITVRNFGENRLHMVMIHPQTNRFESLNADGTIKPCSIVGLDLDLALVRIERWIDTVTPDDVTYYGSFRSLAEYAAWRAELPCGDQEVRWDVTVETTSGQIRAYICTSNLALPQVFESICQDLERSAEGAA